MTEEDLTRRTKDSELKEEKDRILDGVLGSWTANEHGRVLEMFSEYKERVDREKQEVLYNN